VSEEARKVQRRLDDIRTMLAHKSPIDYFILKGISVYYDDRFGGTGTRMAGVFILERCGWDKRMCSVWLH